jgi:uncharacterized protein YjbI with pentapeptide repeats
LFTSRICTFEEDFYRLRFFSGFLIAELMDLYDGNGPGQNFTGQNFTGHNFTGQNFTRHNFTALFTK